VKAKLKKAKFMNSTALDGTAASGQMSMCFGGLSIPKNKILCEFKNMPPLHRH
jgi:hypothetical protein